MTRKHIPRALALCLAFCGGAAFAQSSASSSTAYFCDKSVEIVATARGGSDARGNFVRYAATVNTADTNKRTTLMLKFEPPAAVGSTFVTPPIAAFSMGPLERRTVEIAEERRANGSVSPSVPRGEITKYVTVACQ